MPPIKRFATLTDEEVKELRLKQQNVNTKRPDKMGESLQRLLSQE